MVDLLCQVLPLQPDLMSVWLVPDLPNELRTIFFRETLTRGLAIVAESHLESYEPPPGFRWADGRARSSLERLNDDGEWVSA